MALWTDELLDKMGTNKNRSRTLSLDKLVEWPAQLSLVGDFRGKEILDVGCGLGEKSRYFATHGAASVLGLDSSLAFRGHWSRQARIANLSAVLGDMNELDQVPELPGKDFDLIVAFQTLMFAKDLGQVVKEIASKLKRGGILVCSVPHPFRFVALKKETDDIEYGRAYSYARTYTYAVFGNPFVTLSHHVARFSEYLNALADAGLTLERVEEPVVTDHLRALAPEKAAWMDRYFGIVLFRARFQGR